MGAATGAGVNLSLPGVDRLPPQRDRRGALSQWFTPAPIAKRMAEWAGNVSGRVLEPSAGSGALLDAWLVRCDADFPRQPTKTPVDVVEIDPGYASMIAGADYGPGVHVECGDYLERACPPNRYALGLANPPYEDGADGLFLAKMMRECDRVIALVRLAALAGGGRHDAVWSRVASHHDGWWMPGLAIFPGRPVFDGPESASGSAKSDFCVVKLSRIGTPERTAIEWWT